MLYSPSNILNYIINVSLRSSLYIERKRIKKTKPMKSRDIPNVFVTLTDFNVQHFTANVLCIWSATETRFEPSTTWLRLWLVMSLIKWSFVHLFFFLCCSWFYCLWPVWNCYHRIKIRAKLFSRTVMDNK